MSGNFVAYELSCNCFSAKDGDERELKMTYFRCLILCMAWIASPVKAGEGIDFQLPENCGQIVRVSSSGWEATTGTLHLYQKTPSGKWRGTGGAIAVTLGRNGMGWGRGLLRESTAGPRKIEGDGKAPAGVFTLGEAFGYGEKAPQGCRLEYRQATRFDYFVDDPGSIYYNQWVRTKVRKDFPWKSAENMLRKDDLYEFGIQINHNTSPTVPGAGSAIFFHSWQKPGHPTAGCTAMSKENLLRLMRWLDKELKPLLVQAPEGALKVSNDIR